MQFLTSGIALLSAISLTSAAPAIIKRGTDNATIPWSLTSLSIDYASGRPGATTSTINLTITDPNELNVVYLGGHSGGQVIFPPSTASCSFSWENSASPYDTWHDCTSTQTYSTWSFVMREFEGPAGQTPAFGLEWKLQDQVEVRGPTYTRVFSASQEFHSGEGGNLGGECAGSGACFYGLQNSPLAIQQTEVSNTVTNN